MMAKLRLRWLHTRRPLELGIIFLSTMILFSLPVVIVIGYFLHWSWTGLSQKTLWDWLQLLIIPAVLALGGSLFNFTTSRTERGIAIDNQQEGLLQAYIDKMSELLLEKHLRESIKEEEVRTIARVRTLTVLSRLNNDRKRNILQFLHEANLIDKDSHIVELSEANLSGIDLSGANLSRSDLSGANLSKADLHETDLSGANLSRTDLNGANLSRANLDNSDLSGSHLYKANLGNIKLNKANLSGANLHEVNLNGANLHEANLSGAYLREANLRAAILDKANLSGANLRDANLRGSHLLDANLSEAYLSGADLSNTELTQEQLNQAKMLYNTTMPDGSQHSSMH